jgi:hypothetical protein
MTTPGRAPDITHEESGAITKFYDSDNPYTKEVLSKLTDNPMVRVELERFAAGGYTLGSPNSFVLEGDTNDGRHAELAVLSLGSTTSEDGDAVYLFCIGGADADVIAPVGLSFNDASAAPEREKIGDGVWIEAIEPAGSVASRDDPGYTWNWRRWARCMGGELIGGTFLCAMQCRFIPAAYLKCTMICSAARAVGSLLECSFREL